MSMLKQEIITENSRWMTDCQALIEGTLKLPKGLEEISGILEIAGLAELGEIRAGEGRIDLDGTARFSILYMDKKGEIGCFDSECRLAHGVEEEGITPDMQVLGEIRVGDVTGKLIDGTSIAIRAELNINLYALGNEEFELLEAYNTDKNVEIKEQVQKLPYIRTAKCVQSYVKDELRVPDVYKRQGVVCHIGALLFFAGIRISRIRKIMRSADFHRPVGGILQQFNR